MKKLIIPIGALLLSNIAYAQLSTISSNENYIQTKTYLDYNGTAATKSLETVQYFDGLGRPKQIINLQASPLGKDVVTHIEYDPFGRQVKDYLPVPQLSTSNGNYYSGPLGVYPNTYGNEKIYSEKVLENSPLDRILEQKQVGNAWDNKPIKFGYDANSDGEVKKYTATFTYTTFTSQLIPSGSYAVGQLYKNTVTDEDGNSTIEFKNGQGQVVLVRKVISASESADTYYVYNDYNQLAFVIPPKASVEADPNTVLSDLCYQYKYDGRNRLVEKKLPGKGWEYMVYDKQDRLIMTQDAVMGALKQWLFTKYDQFGRTAYTGLYTSTQVYGTAGRAAEQISADAKGSNNVTRSSTVGFTNSGVGVYYDNGSASYPGSVTTLLTVNYYDTYPTGSPAVTNVFAQPLLTDNPANAQTTKGFLTASYVKNIEDDNWTRNFIWYDTKGRNIGSRSRNYLGGYTVINNKLDFAGVILQTNTYHRRFGTDPEKIIVEKFTYDSQNRLLTHTHQIDSNPVEYLSQNKYNELSQLESKKVGGIAAVSPLQTIAYQYNIRGWMTKINDPANLQNKLFAYELRYNKPNNQFSGSARYNGNISQMSWITQNDAVLRNYSYEYDALNRLKEGRFWDAMNLERGEYHEQLTYDLNGNIKTLLRRGRQLPGYTAPEVMDNLEYHYENGEQSNKLSYLKEIGTGNAISGYPLASGSTGSTITYDLNGNMTTQLDKGISSIQYNYLNLPGKITQNSKATDYIYRADGVKVRKVFGTETTDYLDGFQYMNSVLKFFPTAEGYFNVETGKYVYNYTDHLGNTRLSYAKNGAGLEIIEESNYYPLGLKHEGYNVLTGNPSYQYKYNGKELQETGMYDYGARFYMADIGRWGVVDPLAENSRRWSPYTYAYNNPIRFVDPDGRQSEEVIRNQASIQQDSEISKEVRRNFTPPNEYEVDLKTGKTRQISDLGGDEIDFYHYVGGGAKFNRRTRIVDRATGDDQWMNSSKNLKGYTRRMNTTNWANLFDEFLSGGGPENSLLVGKENAAVKELMETDMYETAVDYFKGTSMNEKTSFSGMFGLLGVGLENTNMQGQFMGKTNFSFYPVGNKVVIMAFDSKSVSSYSLNPFNKDESRNIPRTNGVGVPQSTTKQTYLLWVEKNEMK
ncbi:DUF6443 domain-containing protein [Chryseobacterium indologenes]|uniref:DUF6443 domain-containing protein n=1 Tax=Chryseobacterium indologenes TaxID=253 RepID=UPI001BCF962C|nr:DUF6443 domain-containing protein [Chryseobacterium indologenes]